jgi:eukaryotic-like serine/threonine-protein kinase
MSYTILSQITESLYKARDPESERLVALRSLPPCDAQRKQRVQDAVAAVSGIIHPNLARVFEFVDADGKQFLVTELVEGESLDSILKRERLHRRDLFSFARQIVAALDAAHAAGVIHGGLVDRVVILDAQRHIKVLDCGLARALAVDGEELSPEIACYCSPEQVEGNQLDQRSDIFSFGALLYFMTSRRRAFRRETFNATLEAVLREEPRPLDEVSKHVPQGIEKVIRRCLQKSPGRRYQSMSEIDAAIEKLAAEHQAKSVYGVPKRSRRSEKWLPWIFAAVMLGALAAGVVLWMQGLSFRASQEDVKQITLDTGLDSEPSVSSNGEQVAYASDQSGEGNLDIWIQRVSTKAPVRLTAHASDDHEPSISPDGGSVAFRSERDGGGIYVVPSAVGKDARLLAAKGRRPRYSPDGRWIAYWVGDAEGACKIYVIESGGGEPRQIAPGFAAAYPVWSPNSNSLLFLGKKGALLGSVDTEWWVVPLDSGEPQSTGGCRALRQHAVLRAEGCAAPGDWKGGRIFFSLPDSAGSNLWRAEILSSRDITTKPLQITSGDGMRVQPSVTDQGRVVFSKQSLNVDIWGVPIRANEGKLGGEWKRLTRDAAADAWPSLSGDGLKLLFQSNRRGNQNLWLLDLNSRSEIPIPTERGGALWPRISPDGSRLSFAEEIAGKYHRFEMPVRGGSTTPVCKGCGPSVDWSRDGKRLLIEDTESRSIALAKPGTPDKARLLAKAGSTLAEPRFSPDERWIAFASRTDPVGSRIYVAPLHGEAPVAPSEWVSLTQDDAWEAVPQWSPDGKLVYFISNRDGHRCVWARRFEEAQASKGEPFPVYHFHDARCSPANTPLQATDLFVGKDQMVIGIGQLAGSLWMLTSAE